MEDEVDGFNVGDAGDAAEALGIRFFASLRMTRRRLLDGVEDKGEADVGRRDGEEFGIVTGGEFTRSPHFDGALVGVVE